MTLLEILEYNAHYLYNGVYGTDKEKTHHYVTSFYEEAFKPFQDKSVNVFELGVNSGGSLLLWKEYFKNGNIYGADIHNSLLFPQERYKDITIYFEDGYTENMASKLPALDIAVDDGPHSFDSQNNFIKLYLPKVKPGGLLVIEDIPDIDYVNKFEQTVHSICTDTIIKVFDTRKEFNQFDNIVFAVWKN